MGPVFYHTLESVSYTHLRAHETGRNLVCRLLLEKKRENFDLIFADPPYSKYDITRLVEPALEHLNKKGKFILECDKKQFPILEAVVKDYGQTRILYWENS